MWHISTPRREAAVFAMLCVAALAGVDSPPVGPRQAIAGHFNVPPPPPSPRIPTDGSANAVTNGDFESGKIDGGWYQCGDRAAYTTREHPFDGAFDEYSGTASGVGEPMGTSGVCEAVTIPVAGLLTAQLYQLSNESDTRYASQEADLLDDRGNVVLNLFKTVNDARRWVRGQWNLGAYAGRTYWLYFGVNGDGYRKSATQQFVDDVTLTGSGSRNAENPINGTPRPRTRVLRERS